MILLPSALKQHEACGQGGYQVSVDILSASVVCLVCVGHGVLQILVHLVHDETTVVAILVHVFLISFIDRFVKIGNVAERNNQVEISISAEKTGNGAPVLVCFFT